VKTRGRTNLSSTQRIKSAACCASYAGALALIIGAVSSLALRDIHAAVLPAVTPVMSCADLLKLDFTSLGGAPHEARQRGRSRRFGNCSNAAVRRNRLCGLEGEIYRSDANANLDPAARNERLRRILWGSDSAHPRVTPIHL